jgi:hypothetical protein
VPDASDPEGRTHHRPALHWGEALEHDNPGARYGLVLILLLITFVFMAAGPTGDWVDLVTVILQGLTLLAALAASEAGHRLLRIAVVVIVVALVAGVFALARGTSSAHGYSSILSFLLIGVAPIAIATSIWRRRKVDVQTVLGAICIYIFLGMFYAFAYQAVGNFGTDPFFVQQKTASIADYLYFSFVTLTTTGYGDLTAAGGLGRAMAVTEMLLGQIYLVTVIALLVSQLGIRFRGSSGSSRS